ncbi:hypothetical protein DNTS_027223 [Danionella cerebrum]|uniref:BTB/POZ domain-containing protein KCTD9 n=1 Tax=Danionella cerebrum TaxID=2873325 RepID=A0A553REN1_9TELE|nr:hypothetical protein DNTS_027223 [Danionella translucida]
MESYDIIANQPVVIDNGSGVIKAGFAGDQIPKYCFPNYVGRPKHVRVMAVRYPMEHGIVKDWNDMERIWQYVYSKEQLQTFSEEHPVLLTEAPLNPSKNRERAAEVFFETFNVPALFISMQAVLSLYATGRTTGVVLDAGDGVTHAVPIYEGFAIPHSIMRVDIAGRDVSRYLRLLLRKEGYDFHTSAEFEVVRTIKERACYLSLNPQKDETLETEKAQYTLPDGSTLDIGPARFRAPELLFRPDLVGDESEGIHEVLAFAIQRSDMDLRRTLFSNIVLSGGSTLLKGFGDRLLSEVKKLAPKDIKIKISAPQERLYSTWIGGSILASLDTFKKMWISKKEYEEDRVVAVYGSLVDLLSVASTKFGIKAANLYNGKGGLIDDITLIRDDDVLYISEGDAFIDPLRNPETALEHHTYTHTDWITLNVGGRRFTTTRSTLVKEAESMLAHMFRGKDVWGNKQDEQGAFLIDRSPDYFEPILNYLRHGQLIVNDGINLLGVLEEARFFGIERLAEQLEGVIKTSQPPDDHSPISRKEFVRFLLATPTKSELRCQVGLNFSGADLSRLDLRYINFKMANLSRCNLTHANLCGANLERADLSSANLDGANLQGVKMLCTHAEGASLKGCNFEDPAGIKANLEGANLKGVDMEGSQMTGINLRVATLKNAKLKNCNLRGATLAGTDLENCDLSGCDLQEANLRGSNVKGAIFEEMLTPLHMSQSVR